MMKKLFKLTFLLLFSLIFIAPSFGADEALYKIAQDNVPVWLYQKAQADFEGINLENQQLNNGYGKEVFNIFKDQFDMINWTYQKLDLEKTDKEDFLFIAYCYRGMDSAFVILKEENNAYYKVWESSPQTEMLGMTGTANIKIDDLNGDGGTEIILRASGENARTDYTTIIKWQGNDSRVYAGFINTEFADLDRDGRKEIIQHTFFTEDVILPDGTIEQANNYQNDILKWNGQEYILEKINSEKGIFIFTHLNLIPLQWPLSWATTSQSDYIKVALSAIDESHAVTEIDPASVRLEERVKPVRTWIEGDKFFAEFDKREAMVYLLNAPRLKPLQGGDKINITVSALLQSGQYVSGSSEIELVDTTPFKEFSLKHWRIHWDQGKHDKNKFQFSGRIDLPDDYTLDMLQKKGIVSIAIEKKDSQPFSQATTLNFAQHGPIWRYKAPKKQTSTEPLFIEKMLIFWQIEGLESKPDKQGHAGKGHGKRAGWFMIQGNINISDTDQAALLPKAALTLNIPVENITTAGALESRAEIEFKVHKNLWSYNAAPHNRWKDWQESWWEKVKED